MPERFPVLWSLLKNQNTQQLCKELTFLSPVMDMIGWTHWRNTKLAMEIPTYNMKAYEETIIHAQGDYLFSVSGGI